MVVTPCSCLDVGFDPRRWPCDSAEINEESQVRSSHFQLDFFKNLLEIFRNCLHRFAFWCFCLKLRPLWSCDEARSELVVYAFERWIHFFQLLGPEAFKQGRSTEALPGRIWKVQSNMLDSLVVSSIYLLLSMVHSLLVVISFTNNYFWKEKGLSHQLVERRVVRVAVRST